MKAKKKNQKIRRKILFSLLFLMVGLLTLFFIWTKQVKVADQAILQRVNKNKNISIRTTDHSLIMIHKQVPPSRGLVFIPGAKITADAYLFKLSNFTQRGIAVVITKPTLNLAFFDLRPLSTFTREVPKIKEWYVAGHSLGGVKACQYTTESKVKGLILFASYCATDVTKPVLSISGSADRLTTKKDIDNTRKYYKGSYSAVEIVGANHARFGDYGKQSGDGEAQLTTEDMKISLNAIITNWFDTQSNDKNLTNE